MSKINIIDAICGAGKTQYAIQMINHSNIIEDKFIYITPFLKEVERVKKNVKTRRFYEPTLAGGQGSKYKDFENLLTQGENIVSTHNLFTRINADILDKIKYNNYTLILDEVINVTENIIISNDDWNMLISQNKIEVDQGTNKILWLDPEYTGKFHKIKSLADSNNLYLHTRSSDKKNKILLVWTFPIEVFKSFKEVFNLTYMFDGQLQKYYFDMYDIEYKYFSVKLKEDTNTYKLCDYNIKLDNREIYKNLINIYEGNLNSIGDDTYSLSKSWLTKSLRNKNITILKNHTYNYFNNIINSKSKFNMWTTLKGNEGKKDTIRLALTGKGYTRGFIPVNSRSTNEYVHKNCCAYLVNRFLNPIDRGFFEDKGINVNEDVWALSELLQWLFRSAIRVKQPINLYIPSSRMRKLLLDWLDYKI